MGFIILGGVGKEFHERFIYAEHNAQHTAAYSRKYGSQPDESSLQNMKRDAKDILYNIFLLFHFESPIYIPAGNRPGGYETDIWRMP